VSVCVVCPVRDTHMTRSHQNGADRVQEMSPHMSADLHEHATSTQVQTMVLSLKVAGREAPNTTLPRAWAPPPSLTRLFMRVTASINRTQRDKWVGIQNWVCVDGPEDSNKIALCPF
jgi:hypothetical protein